MGKVVTNKCKHSRVQCSISQPASGQLPNPGSRNIEPGITGRSPKTVDL